MLIACELMLYVQHIMLFLYAFHTAVPTDSIVVVTEPAPTPPDPTQTQINNAVQFRVSNFQSNQVSFLITFHIFAFAPIEFYYKNARGED